MATKKLKPISSKNSLLTSKALFLVFIIFVLLNLGFGSMFNKWRLDLTEDKIYTLSPATKQILDNLDKSVTLKLFYSKKLTEEGYPFLNSYYNRIKDFLEQYVSLSPNLVVEYIDPEPFSESEDDAVDYNLQGVPVDQDGNEIYFGMVGITEQKAPEVIPFFNQEREAYLEYDISQIIQKLASNIDKKVGIISSLPITGDISLYNDSRPWMIWDQLKQSFDVALLDPDVTEIDSDVNVLMLVKPSNLNDKTLYAIDQFVMRGGKVLAFVSAKPNIDLATIKEEKDETLDISNKNYALTNLLNAWGVRIIPDKYVSIPPAAKLVSYNKNSREFVNAYPLWVDLDKKYFSDKDIITSDLTKLTLINPVALTIAGNATTNVVPLITSGTNSALVDANKLETYRQDPEILIKEHKADGNNYTLAARVTGPIYSAFGKNIVDEAKPHISKVDDSSIIVFGSPDMLRDEMWIQLQNIFGSEVGVPTSGNGGLIISSIENLLGSNSLISIRNKGTYARPFTKISEIEMASRKKYQAKEQELLSVLESTKSQLSKLKQQNIIKQTDDLEVDDNNERVLDLESEDESASIAELSTREKFKTKLLNTRRELREVRLALRNDIEDLQLKVKFFNTALIPIVLAIIGFFVWIISIRNRRND